MSTPATIRVALRNGKVLLSTSSSASKHVAKEMPSLKKASVEAVRVRNSRCMEKIVTGRCLVQPTGSSGGPRRQPPGVGSSRSFSTFDMNMLLFRLVH